jgi:dephospho-CoA kinase
MLVVGLTGGIGSGKTTVANLFAKLGAPVIDADEQARLFTKPDSPVFMDIIDHFDEPLLQEDGTLDRSLLRQIIFAQPDQRHWLENLLHPLIIAAMEDKIRHTSYPYCILVIPLLLETGPYPFIDRILVIDTTVENQRKRVLERDKHAAELIQSIIDTQITREARQSLAHDLIQNDGVPSHLAPQVEKLHDLYLSLGKNENNG